MKAFLAQNLGQMQDAVPDLKERVALWKVLRKQDALQAASSGDSRSLSARRTT